MNKTLTEWMQDAPKGSRLYFREYPNSEWRTTNNYYEKIESGNWLAYINHELRSNFEFESSMFGDEEDSIFVREDAE